MMRLQRVGRKNDPTFRIVVVDKRTGPKSNKNIDILGSYNPKMNHVQVDTKKASEWLSKGVQPSDTVHNILVGQNVIEAPKKNVLPKKSPIVSENTEEETADATATTEAPADGDESAESEGEAAPEESADAPAEEAETAPAEETVEASDSEATDEEDAKKAA